MIAFMVALSHQEVPVFEQHLRDYIDPSASYIIGMEIAKDAHQDTSGHHLHICVDMDELKYDRFRKSILVNKYRLAGQAKLGRPRQYGRIRKLRDVTKILCYTVKDTNIVYRGYTLEAIQELIDKSYPRPERTDIPTEILKELEDPKKYCISDWEDDEGYLLRSPIYNFSVRNLEEKIIQIYIRRKYDRLLTKSLVRHIALKYMVHHRHLKSDLIDYDDIINYIMR